jgi:hypothetical protein
MPTTETPVLPFADLPAQFLEASTRAITASADLYSEVVRSQADATAGLIDAYLGAGRQAAETGGEAAATAEQAATTAVRDTARAGRRATKRTGAATRKAAATTRKAAAGTRKAAATAPKAAAATSRRAAAAVTPEPPIAGYGDLTADELVAKLPELSQVQLVEVGAYEQANDKRTTVLERVAALSGPEPAPGYDELTADDVQKLLTGGDAELAASVRDYERRHKNRASVIEAAVRHADAS